MHLLLIPRYDRVGLRHEEPRQQLLDRTFRLLQDERLLSCSARRLQTAPTARSGAQSIRHEARRANLANTAACELALSVAAYDVRADAVRRRAPHLVADRALKSYPTF